MVSTDQIAGTLILDVKFQLPIVRDKRPLGNVS